MHSNEHLTKIVIWFTILAEFSSGLARNYGGTTMLFNSIRTVAALAAAMIFFIGVPSISHADELLSGRYFGEWENASDGTSGEATVIILNEGDRWHIPAIGRTWHGPAALVKMEQDGNEYRWVATIESVSGSQFDVVSDDNPDRRDRVTIIGQTLRGEMIEFNGSEDVDDITYEVSWQDSQYLVVASR